MQNLLELRFWQVVNSAEARSFGLDAVISNLRLESAHARRFAEGWVLLGSDAPQSRSHAKLLALALEFWRSEPEPAATVLGVLRSAPDTEAVEEAEVLRLSRVYLALSAWRKAVEDIGGRFEPLADELVAVLQRLYPLLARLDEVRAPGSGFAIADSATPKLNRIRTELSELSTQLSEARAQRIRRVRTLLGLDPQGGEFVLVARGSDEEPLLRRSPELELVKEERSSVLFRIAADERIVELEERLAALAEHERAEEARICRRLIQAVADAKPLLDEASAAAGRLEFLLSAAELAQSWKTSCSPRFDQDRLALEGAYFLPLADELGEEYTPLEVELGRGVSVLEGGNMSGKSVVLRTVALCFALAALGLPVPATFAAFPSVSGFYFLCGELLEKRRGLSAFGAEVEFFRRLLESPRQTLVVADEPFRTTNAREGGALLAAVLEALADGGATVLVSTHYSLDSERFEFFHMAGIKPEKQLRTVERRALSPSEIRAITEYRVLKGHGGRAQALEVARLLGLPESVLERARALIDS